MDKTLKDEEVEFVFAMFLNRKIEKGMRPIKMIDPRGNKIPVTVYALNSDRDFLREARLLLTPLSEITDEHLLQLGRFDYKHLPFGEKGTIQTMKETRIAKRSFTYKQHSFLIQHAYDVPIFFEVDHWANGMTPLELKLAITK